MIGAVTDPADLGVVEAADALARARSRLASSSKRASHASRSGTACTATTATRRRSTPGRVCTARTRSPRPQSRTSVSQPAMRPRLCGVPIGLKDLYAVAGKPLTASSGVLDEVSDRDCDAWARLAAEGMVLLGHLHTHEFACGGTTDQVGNPWALERSAGGSSGGSAAALASGQVAAATGTRHRRLAAHPLGGVRDVDDQAHARARPAARNRPALADVRPCRADGPHRARLRAAARGARQRRAAARTRRPAPLRPLAPDLGPRPGRRRRARARTRGASGRARRTACPGSPPGRRRRVLRPRAHRDAPVPPPLRAPPGGVPLLEPRPARARGGAGHDRRGVHREPERPGGGHRRLARLVRGAPYRRRRRADHPDRRTPARPRLRGAVRRSRRPFADVLLGLDRIPRGCAAHRRRPSERPARRASRSSGVPERNGISSRGARRCRTNSVRSRRDRPRGRRRDRRARPRGALPRRTRSDAARAPRGRAAVLRHATAAPHGRRRRRLLPRAAHGGGRLHRRLGGAQRHPADPERGDRGGSRRERRCADPVRERRSRPSGRRRARSRASSPTTASRGSSSTPTSRRSTRTTRAHTRSTRRSPRRGCRRSSTPATAASAPASRAGAASA